MTNFNGIYEECNKYESFGSSHIKSLNVFLSELKAHHEERHQFDDDEEAKAYRQNFGGLRSYFQIVAKANDSGISESDSIRYFLMIVYGAHLEMEQETA